MYRPGKDTGIATPMPLDRNSTVSGGDYDTIFMGSSRRAAVSPYCLPEVKSPGRSNRRELVPGEPVWAWMMRDRWWSAVILSPAPDSSLEGARVTIRLAHGVSVTVPTKYLVRREPSLDGKDKPIQLRS